jgi:hypothetical protein
VTPNYTGASAGSATSVGYSYMMRMSISLNLMSRSASLRSMRMISWLASLPLSLMWSTHAVDFKSNGAPCHGWRYGCFGVDMELSRHRAIGV